MKKLVVHIGLPKTGSTALQDIYFSNAKFSNALYVGKAKDKSKNHEIIDLIKAYVDAGESSKNYKKEKFLKELGRIEEETIILSEEMLVVDTIASSWQKKIERLADVEVPGLLALDSVVVVVRDPVFASYSFFVETINVHRTKRENMVDFICGSNQYKIYDYPYFISFLKEKVGSNKIAIYKYEDLLGCKEGVGRIVLDLGGGVNISNDKVNSKKMLEQGYVSASLTLKDSLRRFLFFRLMIQLLPNGVYALIAKMTSKIKLKEGSAVDFLSAEEAAVVGEKLRSKKYGELVFVSLDEIVDSDD